MALTRPDTMIPKGVWTDLYLASGIAVGTALSIYNKGTNPCLLSIKATAPTDSSVGIPLYGGGNFGSFASVAASEVGLWAYSEMGSRILIQE